MKRLIGLALAAVAVGALALPLQAGAQTLTHVHYFGILRSGPGGWNVLDDAGHTPQGINGVTCHTSGSYSGRLEVTYPTVTEVGVFTITPDETWAGKHHPGASVGFSHAYITIRNSSGSVVSCNSSSLSSPSGNLWVDFWGWV